MPQMNWKHLFWDFDGTLYDTYPQIVRAAMHALRDLGITSEVSPNEILTQLKFSVTHAIHYFVKRFELDAHVLSSAFHRYHAQESHFVPYAGLADCLHQLHDAGFHHYLYTHRNIGAIDQLRLDSLWSYFTDAVTSDDNFPAKPSPDALVALMARNGIMPADAVMIGDRDIDIEAGRNAGISGILFDPDGFFPDVQAQLHMRTMDELQRNVKLRGNM